MIQADNGAPGNIMSEQSVREPGRSNRSSYTSDKQRRQQVIAATWRVISREGISAASLRTIAAEMDATTGLVTRYFPEKEGLLLAALEKSVGFLNQEIAMATINLTGKARLEAAVLAALPMTPERLQAWKIWVAFMAELPGAPDLARAHAEFPGAPDLASVHAEFPGGLRQMLVKSMREAQIADEIAAEIYPPQRADMLVIQIIGLGVLAVNEPGRYPAVKLPSLIAPLYNGMIVRPN